MCGTQFAAGSFTVQGTPARDWNPAGFDIHISGGERPEQRSVLAWKTPCDSCRKWQVCAISYRELFILKTPLTQMGLDGVLRLAIQRSQRGDFGERVGFTFRPLASEPIPLWRELLNERTRKRNVAAPTLPNRNRLAGKFGRAILCIFKELEAPLLGTIKPEDNSFAECGRLVVVSEFHPPLEVATVRRGDVLDHRPGRF